MSPKPWLSWLSRRWGRNVLFSARRLLHLAGSPWQGPAPRSALPQRLTQPAEPAPQRARPPLPPLLPPLPCLRHVMRSQLGASQLGEEESAGVESQAFWCFARLMDRMELNFSTDCT